MRVTPEEQDIIDLIAEAEAVEALKAEVAATQEWLAEMRELVMEAKPVMYVQGYRRWTNRADKALSAAPKRGRVIWRGKARTEHFGGAHDNSQGTSFHAPGWIGKDDEILSLTVREEADAPTGPIDCPMCGVAGGDELGPCSMCKGAGFVEAE